VEAAEPLGVPVFPVVAYGLTPYFLAYPGTISLRMATYAGIIGDILDSLHATGFRRILFVNGHGGNTPADTLATEWAAARPEMRIKFHNWWNAPKTWAKAVEIDPIASHASWLENFPWTRAGRCGDAGRAEADARREPGAAHRARPCATTSATATSAATTSATTPNLLAHVAGGGGRDAGADCGGVGVARP
jgi:creatinine amidohydrolase/Fe(II)-dependent formamide hydrolase-like protein